MLTIQAHSVDYNAVADITGLSSFVLLVLSPKSEKSRDILQKLELIEVQGRQMLSTLMSIESAYETSC